MDGWSTARSFDSQLITTLFNELLEQETYPDAWSTDIIEPIYKMGDKKDPNNTRGITLLPVLSKIFTSIIRDRLVYWAEVNGKLNEAQFGFMEGRTIGPIFILSAIQVHKKKRKPLYAFVDFAKAFDSITIYLVCANKTRSN